MMESINLRAASRATRLQAIPPTLLAQMPPKFGAPSRYRSQIATSAPSVPRTVKRHRDRWSMATNVVQFQPPAAVSSLKANPCQWLLAKNSHLAELVTATIGDRWLTQSEDLQQLDTLADRPQFQAQWQAVKRLNKQILATELSRLQGIELNVDSLFDLHLAPISGAERQLLNILHIINLCDRIKQHPVNEILPRTFIFSEPESHLFATQSDDIANERRSILALIESLASVVAADADLRDKIQVVYVPAAVGLTSQLYAAADLTEQIATAAWEDIDLSKQIAAINGVVSIGSLGKTNYWLQQVVGTENCFRFGLAIPEIALFKEYGYAPDNYYKYYPQIRRAIDTLHVGYFTPNEPDLGRTIVELLLGADEAMVMADYIFYAACQAQVSQTYHQTALWTRMSISNAAGVR
ncbi:glycogen/starch/alpha-glucan phosphorylase [Chamaesiphon sp. VAR_69_metabat_338]|uniref:glycogen/starch/alpha-glucan phosphorylase n=1 Tax=Chamaesiphon sp. VAR_69_metabat_338 TaxID=2964704 RepID=UPI00286D7ED5|nr:glycogen/starch/alpha-glucan phosphorylase [Chamaesiphon sp. VAR_69_metabat_338]